MPLKSLLVIFEKFNILALCDNIFEIMGFRYVLVGSMPLYIISDEKIFFCKSVKKS